MELDRLKKVAFILKTIAHPMRIAIVELLTDEKELSVGTIGEKLDIEQSLLSHHLTNMKLKGVLSCRREGKQMLYSLKLQEVVKVIDCMRNCDIKAL